MDRPLYSVHLFAGAGGGILADLLHGIEPRIAVEIEPYPRRVRARPEWRPAVVYLARIASALERIAEQMPAVPNPAREEGGDE